MCRQYPQLLEREELVSRLVLERYRELMARHRGRALDGRGETHLQVAALLLATHKVLSPWIRDPQARSTRLLLAALCVRKTSGDAGSVCGSPFPSGYTLNGQHCQSDGSGPPSVLGVSSPSIAAISYSYCFRLPATHSCQSRSLSLQPLPGSYTTLLPAVW